MSELNKLGSEVPATLRAALTELCAEGAELRLAHRLHALLLVSLGRSCQEVAGWFGESPRTVQRWQQGYSSRGLDGLRDHWAGGRPARLSLQQRVRIAQEVRALPHVLGLTQARWSGKLLSRRIEALYGVRLSERQCQRLLRGDTCE